jgi:predicted flap endonuclease-1-like 5' DNA nuclease
LGLGNLDLGILFMLIAGFLLGMVPAFILFGAYFGRRYDQQVKSLKQSFERQVAMLRATAQRLMARIDLLTGENQELQTSNTSLREAVREQHELSDKIAYELEVSQNNTVRLQERVDELEDEKQRYEGRLEQARIHQERANAQSRQALDQVLQTERLRRNLLFATRQLRENKVAGEALEQRLRKGVQPVKNGDTTNAEQLDIGLIEGIDAEYAEKLHDSGIHTIGDLAQQTPARVAYFAGLDSWDDSAAWIAEAKIRIAGSSAA